MLEALPGLHLDGEEVVVIFLEFASGRELIIEAHSSKSQSVWLER